MICPDCGIELNEDNKVKRGQHIGLCKRCAKRIESLKYLNKKNGTNKEYIPLKDLKYVDSKEYNRVMGRRMAGIEREEKQTKGKRGRPKKDTSVNIIKSNKDDLKILYYGKVSKDLDNAFKEAGINQNYTKHKDLASWIDTFIGLLETNDNENFIMQCKKGEDIFNKMQTLYNHHKENLDWDDIDKINEIGFAEKALNELRRPTKELLDYYYSIDGIVQYLRQDETFMGLLKTAKEELDTKKRRHEDPKFYSPVNSNLVDDVKIVAATEPRTKIYDCTVWCYNLNGNPRKSLFRANGGIQARNEIDAKLKLKNFLSEKFPSVIYNDKDITIKAVSSREEVNELARRSCS